MAKAMINQTHSLFFSSVITVPRLTTIKHITLALEEIGAFEQEEIKAIAKGLSTGNYRFLYFHIP